MGKYESIIEHIRKEDAALFVGSGCSFGSNAPSATKIANSLYDLIPEDLRTGINKDDLKKVSSVLEASDGNRDRINSVLSAAFCNLQPNSFHKGLSQVPYIHTIITTNYDSLIEDAYTFAEYFQVLRTDNDCATYDRNKIHLYKIHGDLNATDRIVISEDDYRRFIDTPTDPIIWSKIQSEVATQSIVFVGYSAEDGNVLNLIEQILQKVGSNAKKMFLVCPSLLPAQRLKLKQLKIEYIDGTCDEFISEVISGLKDGFGEDKHSNLCSLETLNRFALLNGLQLSFEKAERHTSITRISPYNGSIKHNLHFNTKTQDFLSSPNTILSDKLIKGFQVPVYSLSKEEMATFEHRANGLRLNGTDDYQSVWIVPLTKTIDVTLCSKEYKVRNRCKASVYGDGKSVHFCVPTSLCNIEYSISKSETDPLQFSGTVTFHLNDGITDIDDAIKWAKFLVAFIDGNDMKFCFNGAELCMVQSRNPQMSAIYNDLLEYYSTVKEIEDTIGECFDTYSMYSPDGLFTARVIKSYLTHTVIIAEPREELKKFKMDLPKGEFSGSNPSARYLIQAITKINNPLVLNGKEFIVPEENALLKECKVEIVDTSNPDYDTVEVETMSNDNQYQYCDAGASKCLFQTQQITVSK